MGEFSMHRVFISYHHNNDQYYKEEFVRKFDDFVFFDRSVNTRDIDESLSDDRIREIIRNDYLGDTSVTIILVGRETKHRKHIDWEIYSSMYNGSKNRKSGILVINLPTISQSQRATSDVEKNIVAPNSTWVATKDFESTYPYLPLRLVDNFKAGVPITAVNYEQISNNSEGLRELIDIAYNRRVSNTYDLSRPMRRHNG